MWIAKSLSIYLAVAISTEAASDNQPSFSDSVKSFFNQVFNKGSATDPKPSDIPSAKTAADELSDLIVPHMATYKITLEKNLGDDIDDANGWMTIKVFDTGDGWVFEQNSSLIVYAASGEGEQVNTNVASWQDYAGNHYRFNSRTLRNGQEEEVIRGEAHKGAEGAPGKIIYSSPTYAEIDIPNETIFPLHHLIYALKAAKAGKTVISNVVFDGSSETQEPVDVNTVIGPKKESKLILKDSPSSSVDLKNQWLLTLGVYAHGSKTLEPEYELKQTILDHAVTRDMTIDYGTFQVKATLEKIEFFI